MKVKCFKLLSGADIIARVDSEDSEGNVELSRVMMIQAYPSPQGIAVSLVPFVLFADPSDVSVHKVLLPSTAYLLPYTPKEDLATAYLEQSSGISLVRGGPQPMKA